MKSSHNLFHDRASKGLAVSLCQHACKEVCDVKPGLDPCPLQARSWNRWWLDFITFIAYKKVKIKFKKAKCVSNRCNDLFKRKKYFEFRCTLILGKEIFLLLAWATKHHDALICSYHHMAGSPWWERCTLSKQNLDQVTLKLIIK